MTDRLWIWVYRAIASRWPETDVGLRARRLADAMERLP